MYFCNPTSMNIKHCHNNLSGTLLRHDPALRQLLHEIQGVVIRRSKVAGEQGGITVSRHGHAHIEQTEFKDIQFGIRCLQNAKVQFEFRLKPVIYGHAFGHPPGL